MGNSAKGILIGISASIAIAIPSASAAQPAPLTANMFDAMSPPPHRISEKTREAIWNEYKKGQQCFSLNHLYPDHIVYNVARLSSAQWKRLSIVSPYPHPEPGLAACAPTKNPASARDRWDRTRPPDPIVAVGAIKHYGDQLEDEQVAAFWFEEGTTNYRYNPDPGTAAALAATLVKWARAKALSKNQYDNSEFKFPVTLLIEAMQNAFFEIGATMSPEDRTTVGTYLNAEIAEVERAGSSRPNNHDNLYAYMGAVWGLGTNDRTAVQQAIDTYKRNIEDMRPDGSWPIDSQRGANANQYVSMATGDLVMLAALLKVKLGIDLFSYSVKGRSIHTAVDYVLKMIADPVGTSMHYGLSCPAGDFKDDAGTLLTRATPEDDYHGLHQRAGRYFNETAFLAVYADFFPQSAAAAWVMQHEPETYAVAVPTHFLQATPACLFNATVPAGFSPQ